MPTASYAPFLRFKQSGEFERAKRHVSSWRVSLEFGVGGWRKSNGVGVGIGVEVFEILEILLILESSSTPHKGKRRKIGCGGKK